MTKDQFLKKHGSLLLKIAFIAVLAVFLVFVYSRANAKDVDLNKIEQVLIEKTDIATKMNKASDRDLMQFMGIDASKYEQVLYYRNNAALAVDEFLVVKAKSGDELGEVEEAVNARIKSQIKVYDSYGPEQVKLLKSAVQTKKGMYYIYCVAEKAGEYEEVLVNAVQ